MSQDALDELLAAEAALRARHESPERALTAASELVAREGIGPTAHLVAVWAMALAKRELNDLEGAEGHLRDAMDIAHRIGDDRRVDQVASALVAVLTARGRPADALALADGIDGLVEPGDRADLDMKRALAFEQLGRLDDALEAYTRALAAIAHGDDRVLEARARCNRSIVLVYRGDTDGALRDAEIAERLATEHGQFFLAGGAAHNHGFTAGRRGDVVTALASFDRADRLYAEVGYPGRCLGVLASDRCEVLMVAGLYDEARSNAEQAVRSLAAVGDVTDLAEALLLLGRACHAQGDHVAARTHAREAQARFEAAGRDGWSTLAEYVATRAAQALDGGGGSESPSAGRGSGASARELADRLDALGWRAEAVEVRVSTARAAIERGDTEAAREHLRVAASARRTGSPDRRANAWLATAMLRRADGHTAGAKRATAAGLRLLAAHQATLGATDLRVGSSTHAAQLAELGLDLALSTARPREVLTWAERVRANALAVPAVRTAGGPRMVAALAELRRLQAELDTARTNLDDDRDVRSHLRLQEAAVRDLARLDPSAAGLGRRFSIDALMADLGPDHQLVEYVESRGAVLAVVVSDRRCRVHRLADEVSVGGVIDDVMFALGRLGRAGSSAASLSASQASLEDALSQLDELLVRPLRLRRDGTVIVPSGVLHRVPWCGLPSLRSGSVTVTASANRWTPFQRGGEPAASVAIIAGPGLEAVGAEAEAVGSSYRTVAFLGGPDASVSASIHALEHADVAHLACHGSFRADSPMFSSLRMADGHVTVYDLERLESPPSIVVLPACNAGRSAVGAGDEVIGTSSALIGVGVRSVIAPVTVVNDHACVALMGVLHRHLSDGAAPADALALARLDVAQVDDPTLSAAASSFVCFA